MEMCLWWVCCSGGRFYSLSRFIFCSWVFKVCFHLICHFWWDCTTSLLWYKLENRLPSRREHCAAGLLVTEPENCVSPATRAAAPAHDPDRTGPPLSTAAAPVPRIFCMAVEFSTRRRALAFVSCSSLQIVASERVLYVPAVRVWHVSFGVRREATIPRP